MTLARRLAAAFFVALLSISTLTFTGSAAHADRCQPEELPPLNQQGIVPESANPVCLVTDNVLYPLLGCPQPTTLMGCQTSIGKIVSNTPNAPTYALNAAAATPGTAVNFTFFVASVLLPTNGSGVVCYDYHLLLPERICILRNP